MIPNIEVDGRSFHTGYPIAVNSEVEREREREEGGTVRKKSGERERERDSVPTRK